MLKKAKQDKKIPELRQDLVTKEWVVISEKRAMRPQEFSRHGKKSFGTPIKKCSFEKPQDSGNAEPVLLYKNKKDLDWTIQIIPNKYPVFTHFTQCKEVFQIGPYTKIEGAGLHEVIIMRDHKKHFALMNNKTATEVIKAYVERYNQIKNDECIRYVALFHNHGADAGATISHPHSQLVATPIIPSDTFRSLNGSNNYYKINKKCVHCVIIDWEKKDNKRILFENSDFIAFVPFVSRVNFEIEIFPKRHESNFGDTTQKQFSMLADILRKSLNSLYEVLKNPSYNFFIHTAPVDGGKYTHYHWHIEIFPKTNIWAGIELGTGLEILMISPENAAKYLKKAV